MEETTTVKKRGFRPDKESVRLVAVLSALALISALILSVVYMFTEATIDYNARTRAKLAENYTSAVSEEIDLTGYENSSYTEITGAYRAEDGAYLIISHSDKAYDADGIDLIVIIKDDEVIKVVKSSSNETPGIGANVTAEGYLSKFSGLSVYAFDLTSLDKNTAAVPYQTNATYSSTGVHYSVNAAIACYFYLKGGNANV